MLLYQELEEELHKAWQELSRLQSYSSSLANQLSSKEGEVAAKEGQLSQLRWAHQLKYHPLLSIVCLLVTATSSQVILVM